MTPIAYVVQLFLYLYFWQAFLTEVVLFYKQPIRGSVGFVWANRSKALTRGGRKVRLIDLPILIRSSDFIGRYNRSMSSSNFCIGRLCRFVLISDSLIVRSCFLVLSSDFCIVRLCRRVLSKKIALPILFLLIIWYLFLSKGRVNPSNIELFSLFCSANDTKKS